LRGRNVGDLCWQHVVGEAAILVVQITHVHRRQPNLATTARKIRTMTIIGAPLAFASHLILAQEAAPQAEPQGISSMFPALVFIMVLFYFLILRPQKGKEQALRDLVANLKEKDRVVTIGGIHGVVTNVQRDRDEVTIRVDESTGTKIRVNSSAIARVVTDENKTES
jgi:preprotein translocase subunit YajC